MLGCPQLDIKIAIAPPLSLCRVTCPSSSSLPRTGPWLPTTPCRRACWLRPLDRRRLRPCPRPCWPGQPCCRCRPRQLRAGTARALKTTCRLAAPGSAQLRSVLHSLGVLPYVVRVDWQKQGPICNSLSTNQGMDSPRLPPDSLPTSTSRSRGSRGATHSCSTGQTVDRNDRDVRTNSW